MMISGHVCLRHSYLVFMLFSATSRSIINLSSLLFFVFVFQKSFCLFYVDLDCVVGSKAKMLVGNKRERRLRVATWNFQGCVLIINKRKLENC